MSKRKFTHPDAASEGHCWETLNGGKVTWIKSFTLNSEKKPIVGVVDDEVIMKWSADGSYKPGESDVNDLRDITEERTIWVNIYPNSLFYTHATKKAADDVARCDRIACVKTTYEEGQFDD